MEIYITKNESDTIALAKNFAKNLKEKAIIVLSRRFRCRQNEIY